jgi:hypothetical protein
VARSIYGRSRRGDAASSAVTGFSFRQDGYATAGSGAGDHFEFGVDVEPRFS